MILVKTLGRNFGQSFLNNIQKQSSFLQFFHSDFSGLGAWIITGQNELVSFVEQEPFARKHKETAGRYKGLFYPKVLRFENTFTPKVLVALIWNNFFFLT